MWWLMVWLGFGKNKNNYLVRLKKKMWFGLWWEDLRRRGYNNELDVWVVERSWIKTPLLTFDF